MAKSSKSASPSKLTNDNEPGPSNRLAHSPSVSSHHSEDEQSDPESSQDGSEDDVEESSGHEGLGAGMDADGFAGPSTKGVKPLTKEELAVFNAAQEKTGVVYISRIPPGMRPTKVRHLMSGYGEVGRVYLQPEGMFTELLE